MITCFFIDRHYIISGFLSRLKKESIMKKGKAVFIIKTLIEVLVPATFAFILLHQSYPPWFTGLFGLNTSFFWNGKNNCGKQRGKISGHDLYREKWREQSRLLAGSVPGIFTEPLSDSDTESSVLVWWFKRKLFFFCGQNIHKEECNQDSTGNYRAF